MRILYNNVFDDYTITAATENANYPASNIQDPRLSRYTRTTALSSQTWDIDTTTAIQPDTIVIDNHNITSGATIQIRASVNSDYSTTDFSATITHDSGTMIKFFTPGSTYRYWRLFITDAANTDLYIKMGRVFMGNYLQLTPSSKIPFDDARETTSKTYFSQTNQVYGNEGEDYIIRNYEFSSISSTMRDSIDTFQNTVDVVYPFYFVNTDEDYSVFPVLYCVLQSKINFKAVGNSQFTYTMSIREVE